MYNPATEAMPLEKLQKLQTDRLLNMVKRVYEKVPAYREKFDAAGFYPADLADLTDLTLLPFTTNQDLRENYPYGLFAVPFDEIVRIHATENSAGGLTIAGYTKSDLTIWGQIMARTVGAAGVSSRDIAYVSCGAFSGALCAAIEAETIDCAAIPVVDGNLSRHVTLLRELRPTALVASPAYALSVAEYMEETGISAGDFRLVYGFFGGGAWSESQRQVIQEKLGLKAFAVYGLPEIMEPGIAYECDCQNGLHIVEDHYLVEIIDPAGELPVPDGQPGEITVTCLTKEAMPLLRYRTGQTGIILREACPCGRTSIRMVRT